ncbi:hypothetical protein CL2_00230 [Anaerostipes hadrus]|uniref:Uncharacterized protein n=1 Tax=Anaerostipes hadrus TaxID=649756 RepID=D4MX02_ANAHA|nr:hypothetical protein [Anaerostipes hadrus]CBL37147.1 hypothetical protein CL2_00230 [Anaerostipes hadrus]
MYDYSGDMSFFQNQLSDAGITKDMLDLDEFAGSTQEELQLIVDYAIKVQKSKEDQEND